MFASSDWDRTSDNMGWIRMTLHFLRRLFWFSWLPFSLTIYLAFCFVFFMMYYDSIHSLTTFQCLRHLLDLGLGLALIATSGIHSRITHGLIVCLWLFASEVFTCFSRFPLSIPLIYILSWYPNRELEGTNMLLSPTLPFLVWSNVRLDSKGMEKTAQGNSGEVNDMRGRKASHFA